MPPQAAGCGAGAPADDRYNHERGWDYGCDYQVLYKFEHPITLNDLRRDPYMAKWAAFRANFQRRAYAIPDGIWQRLRDLLRANDPRFARFVARGAV